MHRVGMHGNDDQPLIFELVVQLHQRGHPLTTRIAPIAPEIEDDDLAVQAGERDGSAIFPALDLAQFGRGMADHCLAVSAADPDSDRAFVDSDRCE